MPARRAPRPFGFGWAMLALVVRRQNIPDYFTPSSPKLQQKAAALGPGNSRPAPRDSLPHLQPAPKRPRPRSPRTRTRKPSSMPQSEQAALRSSCDPYLSPPSLIPQSAHKPAFGHLMSHAQTAPTISQSAPEKAFAHPAGSAGLSLPILQPAFNHPAGRVQTSLRASCEPRKPVGVRKGTILAKNARYAHMPHLTSRQIARKAAQNGQKASFLQDQSALPAHPYAHCSPFWPRRAFFSPQTRTAP